MEENMRWIKRERRVEEAGRENIRKGIKRSRGTGEEERKYGEREGFGR